MFVFEMRTNKQTIVRVRQFVFILGLLKTSSTSKVGLIRQCMAKHEHNIINCDIIIYTFNVCYRHDKPETQVGLGRQCIINVRKHDEHKIMHLYIM